jgi:trk system potassium uptake protein TrkH
MFLDDIRPVLLVLGSLMTLLGAAMLIPALADLAAKNDDWEAFVGSSVLTMFLGSGFWLASRGSPGRMSLRQAFVLTVLVWVVLSLFGALPFYLSGNVSGFADAFFETMSGLTTTGSTILTGLDSMPPGIILWRAILQWLGGLGIIVLAVAVLPLLQVGGMQLFKVEAFETPDKILPRATQVSSSLTLVYVVSTLFCVIAYAIAGMGAFDSLVHGMTTVATGGFSSHDDSLGYYDSAAIETVSITFMIVGSLPFLLYVQAAQARLSYLVRDTQVRTFLLTLAGLIGLLWIYRLSIDASAPLTALRAAAFNMTSIMTGTGYASTDYSLWGTFAISLFFVATFIGGCAGSTSCGIKIFRVQVLFADINQAVRRMVYPHGIFVKRFNGRPLPDRVSAAVLTFFFLYFVTVAVVAVVLSMMGLDTLTAMSAAATSVSNVGPGLGATIGPSGTFEPLSDAQTWVLSLAMLVGRLEILTVLVLFVPRFWRA